MTRHDDTPQTSGARGSMSVELALLLTFFLMPLLVGIVDFGQILHAQIVVTRAAREGALAASRNQDVDAAVTAFLQNAGLDASRLKVSTAGTRTAGDPVTVSVGYDTSGMVIIPWASVSPNLTQVAASATAQQF